MVCLCLSCVVVFVTKIVVFLTFWGCVVVFWGWVFGLVHLGGVWVFGFLWWWLVFWGCTGLCGFLRGFWGFLGMVGGLYVLGASVRLLMLYCFYGGLCLVFLFGCGV